MRELYNQRDKKHLNVHLDNMLLSCSFLGLAIYFIKLTVSGEHFPFEILNQKGSVLDHILSALSASARMDLSTWFLGHITRSISFRRSIFQIPSHSMVLMDIHYVMLFKSVSDKTLYDLVSSGKALLRWLSSDESWCKPYAVNLIRSIGGKTHQIKAPKTHLKSFEFQYSYAMLFPICLNYVNDMDNSCL